MSFTKSDGSIIFHLCDHSLIVNNSNKFEKSMCEKRFEKGTVTEYETVITVLFWDIL